MSLNHVSEPPRPGAPDPRRAIAAGSGQPRCASRARCRYLVTAPFEMPVAAAIRSWLRSASNLRRITSLILRMVFLLAGIPLPQKMGRVTRATEVQRKPEARIPFHRDRCFRTVTAVSEETPKSVTFDRNHRSRCSGITGHVRSESSVTLLRKPRSPWSGIRTLSGDGAK